MKTSTLESNKLVAPEDLARTDLRIHGHSPLLYWWPIWAVGFVCALWTLIDGRHMFLAPANSIVAADQVTAPAGGSLVPLMVHVAKSPIPGALFVTTLLAVAILTHTWLRGVWALLAAASLIAFAFLLSWMEWWGTLFGWLRSVQVYMNLGAYLVISIPILVAWLAALFFFDRRVYLDVSLGQIRVRDQLGSEEKSFDTAGVMFEKKPYDWTRWLLGVGAGDLLIRVGGPSPQVIEMPNVIRIGKWLGELEQRLRTHDVE